MPCTRLRRSGGFTIVELLVVIGIIGALSAVLMSTFGGSTESAKAAKCMTNMRNLAVGVHAAAMADEHGYFPAAGPYEYLESDGYAEVNGWISWSRPRPPHSANPYERRVVRGHRRGPKNTQVSSGWMVSLAYRSGNPGEHDLFRGALTNGLAWLHSGRNAESYVCPKHAEAFRKEGQGYTPGWSYVMNSYFGYDNAGGKTMHLQHRSITGLTSLRSGIPLAADKLLLFAEVPFETECPVQDDAKLVGGGGDTRFNSVLEYAEKRDGQKGWNGLAESIGFNHRSGKRWVGHVAFADGHVARFMLPRDASKMDVQNLTTWLCQGDEVVFQNDRYERTSQVDEKLN